MNTSFSRVQRFERLRPVRLLKIALTNQPNLPELVPISNRTALGQPISSTEPSEFTPADARQHLVELVNRDMRQTGRSWEVCWRRACDADPELVLVGQEETQLNRIPNRSRAPTWKELHEVAARQRGALANRMSDEMKIPFQEAWQAVKRLEIEAFDKAATINELARGELPIHCTPNQLHHLFWRRIHEAQTRNPGAKFEQAWDTVKLNHPSLFATYVLSFT